jgi:hypothetical protein
MRNKTKKQLEDIIVTTSYAKHLVGSTLYRKYWDAWTALNEMYNRGDA